MKSCELNVYTESIAELPRICSKKQIKRISLICSSSGQKQKKVDDLKKVLHGIYTVQEICIKYKLPVIETLIQYNKIISGFNPDIIISIGGGVVLDSSKFFACFLKNTHLTAEKVIAKLKNFDECVPLLAAPTTAGSGSEATPFAVLYLDGRKYSLENPYLLPEDVILDPDLTKSVPKEIAASSGVDAVCQSLEAIWSVRANEESIKYAVLALQYLIPAIKHVVSNPCDQIRASMLIGSHLAGRAIAISRTTAPHAFSYLLTSKYNIPHGHAVGVMMRALSR